MPQCYDNQSNQYFYCASNVAGYVAGILIPVIIFVLVLCVSLYFRRRQKRARIGAQQNQIISATVPVQNIEDPPQAPYNYFYPPNYVQPTTIIEDNFDKPPSYEQSMQHSFAATNNTSENAPAILPMTSTSSEIPTRPNPPPTN